MRKVKLDANRLGIAMAASGNLTDVALAEKAGITGRTLRNIRGSGNCSFAVWNAIADAVNWNPIDLIVTEGYPPPKSEALVSLLN